MTEHEHTPGPWFVEPCFEGETCWCRCVTNKPDSTALENVVIPSGAVKQGDAYLIAAAPELLTALKLFFDNSLRADWPADIYNAAEAAIAKATGQEQTP